ncbi:hypothetical protein pdam_00023533, partial [Pocillopora damicornis]
VLLIIIVKLALVKYFGRNSTNTPQEDLEEFLVETKVIISLNVTEIVNCCFFLIIIVRSPSFVGFSTVLKDLCRLPNFWTLLLFFLIFFLTGVSTIIQIAHRVDRLVIVRMVLEILDFFSLMILVVFLNHTKLRHTISGRAYILLKGALILFCFRFFLMLVGLSKDRISPCLACVWRVKDARGKHAWKLLLEIGPTFNLAARDLG